jgi:isocitrate dehydrogenase
MMRDKRPDPQNLLSWSYITVSTHVHLTPDGKKLVTVIPGDGIGPEVVRSAQRIIEATGVPIAWEERDAGESVFKRGLPSGVPPETIESVRKTRVVLKGPLGTPIGYGEKSANVTLRKLFETYGNIRPVREMPGVPTLYSGRGVDLVVVRENVEDLYAGIEHMQTPGVAQALKLISRKGCEKIVRLGFEFARSEGRKRVHCATKSNIMKFTEGMLKRVFEEIAKEYPDIESQHIIIDNCCHQMVRRPEQFDVIITTNMNGDILSDLTSGLIGGLGFAPSANIGNEVAIFEAVHGSAPKYTGKNTINPTALIMSATMMLRHLGEFDAALDIEHAVLVTLESGVRPRDVVGDEGAASTTAYTEAIISNLGKRSEKWHTRDYRPIKLYDFPTAPDTVHAQTRRVVGMDVFVESGLSTEELGVSLTAVAAETPFHLKSIANRGNKVYTPTGAMTDVVDQWACRFMLNDQSANATDAELMSLLQRIAEKHNWVHIEKLQEFNGAQGFTLAQGED